MGLCGVIGVIGVIVRRVTFDRCRTPSPYHPITLTPYDPMTLRAINADQLCQDWEMVGTGVTADPGGEGAEVRGVPDIVDPQQGWQGEIPQWMAAIRQVREPCRQRETGAASRRTKGVDQT